MKRQETTHPDGSHGEVIMQEAEYGTEIPNQWSLKLKKLESILIPQGKAAGNNSTARRSMDVRRQLILKKDGSARIVFDVEDALAYSIFLLNESSNPLFFYIEISPDNAHYVRLADNQKLDAGEITAARTNAYSKYVRVNIKGNGGDAISVMLQGIRIK